MIPENDEDRCATAPHARHYQREQEPLKQENEQVRADAVWMSPPL